MKLLADYLKSERGAASREIGIVTGMFGLFTLMAINEIEPSAAGLQRLLAMFMLNAQSYGVI